MSNIQIGNTIAWLEDYDPQAFVALQRAVTNTDAQLDSFMTTVIQNINNWKSTHSVMALQDVLTATFQGTILGVAIKDCTELYGADGFIPYIKSRPTNFSWAVEIESTGGGEGGTPPVQTVTNAELVNWAKRITELTTESAQIEAFKDSVHTASTNHVYNSIFRPKSVSQVTAGVNTLDYIFEVKGYKKLHDVLNPSLPAPNYK